MDVAGVAIATVAAQCISAVLIVRCLMNESGGIRLEFSKLKFNVSKCIQIMRVGLPAGFQGMLFSLSNVVIQSSINSFGEIVVAGSSASSNVEGFIYASMNSVYQATLSFCGQNAGVGDFKRVRRTAWIGQGYVAVLGLVLGGLTVFFGRPLLGIYSDNALVVEAGMERLTIIAGMYAICGMMDVMCGALRGIGYAIMPMIVSLLGACGLRLIWIATVFQIPQFHNIATVYFSYPISWSITLLAHAVCFIWAIKRAEQKYNQNSF